MDHLTSLQSLDLSFNAIIYLGVGLLRNSLSLSNLDLQGNHLSTIMPGVLPSTGKLKMLHLAHNLWQCDCRLLHLPQLASAPPCDKLHDCPATVIDIQTIEGHIQCGVTGWPRPNITWWKNGNLVSPEDTREKEISWWKPVRIFSTVLDVNPGNYTCVAGNSSDSITVLSKPVKGGHQ